MAILSGKRLGPYEILSAIGAGGMGEVYRARDTRLERIVAVKILPDHLSDKTELRERFEREARTVASLNHPHICTLFDVGHQNGTDFLVMEYLEGETLAERLKKGPLPLDQVLRYAIEISDALDKAHRKGITHRDLKPGNVILTKSGAKLLDFGLAKLKKDTAPANATLSKVPTEDAVTAQGTILGTLQYMAPEQLEGKEVDARTDIFAFGAVVYEMATGKKAFEGKSQASLIAKILETDPPPMSSLQPMTPPALDRVVKKCLAKEPEKRWQAASDVCDELKWIAEGGSQAGVPVPLLTKRKNRERLAWSVAALLLVGFVTNAALGTFAYIRREPQDPQTTRFLVYPPDGWRLADVAPFRQTQIAGVPLAVSPDGRRVAFVATNATGKSLLWVRALDALTAQALTGTDDASSPFWSPESRFLGFFAAGKLMKIDLAGGPPITLCDAADNAGGAWSRDGLIVFGQYHGFAQYQPALQKVSASGGVPTAAAVLAQGETMQLLPFFLPDGRHFLYRSNSVTTGVRPIYLATLDSTERKLLLNGDSPNVLYTQGHVLFLRDTMLMAQPFDAKRLVLTGDAFPIAEQIQIQGGTSFGVFSASDNGVLAYQRGTPAVGSQLVWFDRTGKQVGMLGDAAAYSDLELSPDGKRASVSIPESGNGRDIWLYDITRGLRTRFTFDPADELESIWSPDGSQIVFNSRRKGHLDLYQKASSGASTEEVLVEDGLDKYPLSWSPDGRFILYADRTNNNLFVLPLFGDRKPFPFLKTQFNGVSAQFSPDGHWVAYQSNESGKFEVYVAPFPGPGGKWQISTGGGSLPRWRRDGTEIFYLDPDNNLMAAAVNGKGRIFDVGAVKPLLGTHAAQGGRYRYDVSADGQRFLVNTLPEQTASAPITVVLNWTTGIKK
jgi:serine/threonine protein kinase/Tol biopolymer transport system component